MNFRVRWTLNDNRCYKVKLMGTVFLQKEQDLFWDLEASETGTWRMMGQDDIKGIWEGK